MAHVIPLGKLAGVVLKLVSKPIANVVKDQAKVHPNLKQVCESLGYKVHHFSVRVFRLSRDQDVTAKVAELPPQKALERGADLLGEFLIFFLVSGVTINEVVRSSREAKLKASEKEQRKKEKLEKLAREGEARDLRIQHLEEQFKMIQDRLDRLEEASDKSKSLYLKDIMDPESIPDAILERFLSSAAATAANMERSRDSKPGLKSIIEDAMEYHEIRPTIFERGFEPSDKPSESSELAPSQP
mmetsp:Transcript_3538/g.6295  ORF Transcript_3538/g.6295 Transcript_3538/m.6295 type:complete len:243 (-) Transcript_3538:1002-1730(-)